ncbi:MarR family winged helix-turn-helix transcriptional regulator [Levilactobacillus brevis]|uniref:MarR family winged helix-turn-helix transcriptional regulator n=1 Tax=Levilactobacillus brevis TaxID=1580 RepID=UPI00339C9F9D
MAGQEQIQQIMQLYGAITQCYNHPLDSLTVNLPQCQLLGYVASDHLSVAQVAKRLGFSATRTSNLVVDLCRQGYLEQQLVPDDRRRRYLELTTTGRMLLATIEQQLPSALSVLLTDLQRPIH